MNNEKTHSITLISTALILFLLILVSSTVSAATLGSKPPFAAFSASPVSGEAPLKVKFIDKSTGSPTSWKWNFGDETYSMVKNPVHTYSKNGKYTVTLTVKNARGSNTIKKSEYITVQKIPQIKITYPLKTAHIIETITGTAKNTPEGQTVWILIYPHTAHKYYPINKLNIQNGKWSLPAQFGENKDVGTKFDILAVLANKQAHGALNTYLQTCIKTNQWPGIVRLPSGVKTYAKVTVKRI